MSNDWFDDLSKSNTEPFWTEEDERLDNRPDEFRLIDGKTIDEWLAGRLAERRENTPRLPRARHAAPRRVNVLAVFVGVVVGIGALAGGYALGRSATPPVEVRPVNLMTSTATATVTKKVTPRGGWRTRIARVPGPVRTVTVTKTPEPVPGPTIEVPVG